VLVGEPVEVQDLLATAEEQGWAESRLQAAIADRVGQVGLGGGGQGPGLGGNGLRRGIPCG
jgi:hypothetical protein